MVFVQSQPHVACKIKHVSNEKFDYTLCDPWIEPLLGHMLINPKDFRSKHGFFLCLFRKKKLKGKFVLNPTTKLWVILAWKNI